MGTPTTHRDVIAWREALALVEAVYRDTARFPAEEAFGLSAQIRNAALTVPCRLAQGATRDSVSELVRFLGMSCGLLAALDTQLEIAIRLGYLEPSAGAVVRSRRLCNLVSTLRHALCDDAPDRARVTSGDLENRRPRRERVRPAAPGHQSRRITS